jgi:SAM-dependent methyltransferase
MKGWRYPHDEVTHNRRAAARIVPWLLDRYSPNTVLDVGCGLGTWAAVFLEHGCDAVGIDGEQIPDHLVKIPPERFTLMDLEEPLPVHRRFDMAVCLEVAQCLSEPAGQRLVEFLCSAADVTVFSSAVPGQGGTHHVNERWPDYWQQLFGAHGFGFDDEIRWCFWDDDEVEWWYRQNMFIVTRGGGSVAVRAVVHPKLLDKKARLIGDFYGGRVPVRTGGMIAARALLNRFRDG